MTQKICINRTEVLFHLLAICATKKASPDAIKTLRGAERAVLLSYKIYAACACACVYFEMTKIIKHQLLLCVRRRRRWWLRPT